MNEQKKLDVAKLMLRLTVGGLMLFHGIHKLINGSSQIEMMLRSKGLPVFLAYGVPVGEVLAPILLILGIFTLPSALLISITMLFSIPLAFGGNIFSLNPVGGWIIELNMFFLVTSIVIALIGSGKYKLGKFLIPAFFLSVIMSENTLAKELVVDLNHSAIQFEATHLKLTTIPGKIKVFTGRIDINEKDFLKSEISFTADVNSIDTNIEKRDDHLKTADFFDAKNFPKATFKSTSITNKNNKLVLNGELTIRGKTKPVFFELKNLGTVQDPMMKVEKHVFQATGEINRKDFGVSYGPDAIVGDIVKISIYIEAYKKEK